MKLNRKNEDINEMIVVNLTRSAAHGSSIRISSTDSRTVLSTAVSNAAIFSSAAIEIRAAVTTASSCIVVYLYNGNLVATRIVCALHVTSYFLCVDENLHAVSSEAV